MCLVKDRRDSTFMREFTGAVQSYDPQMATHITLFNVLPAYVLGRVWMSAKDRDMAFAEFMDCFGAALGKSRNLDGRQTNRSRQFRAMVWERVSNKILE